MPRPARPLWKARRYARRRHRTWMYAMTLATLGWGTWWATLLWRRVAPESAPGLEPTGWVAGVFAGCGLVAGLLTVRAGRTWMLFVGTAIFANAALLALPWLLVEIP